MSQHLPLLALLSGPPGNDMSPPTPNPKPMRGAALLALIISPLSSMKTRLLRSQKYFLYWFRQGLWDTLRGYWVLASLPRTTSSLQSISEACTLGWEKEKSAQKRTINSTVFITVSPALNTVLAHSQSSPRGYWSCFPSAQKIWLLASLPKSPSSDTMLVAWN